MTSNAALSIDALAKLHTLRMDFGDVDASAQVLRLADLYEGLLAWIEEDGRLTVQEIFAQIDQRVASRSIERTP